MTWFAAGIRGRQHWPKEVTVGATLAALAIPLNIGYAQIAGLPPVVGLYTAIVPMLVLALLCSSRQLVASPDAPIAALIASLLVAMAARPGSPQYVELAYAQALVCAVVFLLFYAIKLGFLADFLSEPVLVGFIAGLAVEILTSIARLVGDGARWIILDAEAITDVDTTGAQALRETVATLRERGVTFALSRATTGLRRLLAHYGLTELTYYDSNEAAAAAYRASYHA